MDFAQETRECPQVGLCGGALHQPIKVVVSVTGKVGRIAAHQRRQCVSRTEREIDQQLALLRRAESIARERGDAEMVAMVLCSSAIAEVETDVARATAKVDEGERLLGQISYPSVDARVVCHGCPTRR